ncbi:MAG: PIN domain-containing protein [Candidatus Hydrogenedentes bacterium]|nr:PIN domain-containing protein [Candidatus Hydrogenedentota bacterium]
MKSRVYVDTSVLSALYDARQPDRQFLTREFWERREQFELGSSRLCEDELRHATDEQLRNNVLQLLQELSLVDVSDEARLLAQSYVARGAFSSAMLNDATHVATAVLNRFEILVSWNFRHLVNR